jgi:hypothetical protein
VLGTTAETQNAASKTTSEINDKNWIEKQFMSSEAFHQTPDGRIQESIAEEQFKPRIFESFKPVTQKLYRQHPATIHTKSKA